MQCSEEEFFDLTCSVAVGDNGGGGNRRKPPPACVEKLLRRLLGAFGRTAKLSTPDYPKSSVRDDPLQIRGFKRKLAEPPGLYSKWEKLVEEYTSRGLTQPGDRLAAIAGLAERRHQETKDQYLMGPWKSNLKTELLWRVRDPTESSKIPQLSAVPTWSWIPINSEVYFPRRSYGLRRFESRMPSPIGNEVGIEKIDIDRVDHNPFT